MTANEQRPRNLSLRYAVVHTQTNPHFPVGFIHITPAHAPLPLGCVWCEGQALPIVEYAGLYDLMGQQYAPRMLPTPRPWWRRWWDQWRGNPPPLGEPILTPGMFHVPDLRSHFNHEPIPDDAP